MKAFAMEQTTDYDVLLDVSGLNCPLPVLKSKAELARMNQGQILKVIVTHPDSPREFKALCNMPQFELVDSAEEPGQYAFWVKKSL
jgi:tRNA 2-thiouridine synthesizing protein A